MWTIRNEQPADFRQVEELTREAFWNHFVPGCDEHYLAHILRDADAFLPALDFVAEAEDGTLVGNIMYSRAAIVDEGGVSHEIILFGPLSVLPAWQGKGVGSALVKHSAAQAKRMGFRVIGIYGDPLYYSRFGFRPASDFGVTPPGGKPHPALQIWELVPGAMQGISGCLHEDALFETLSPEAVEAFDKGFPPREKKVTNSESQRRFRALSGDGV